MADLVTILDVAISTALADPISPELGGNRVTAEVVEAEHIEPEIFVLHKDVDSQFSALKEDFFYSVASVHQLKTLPKGSGTMDEPFFRISEIELSFETIEAANAFVISLKGQIHRLVRANNHYINNMNSGGQTFRFDGSTVEEVVEDEDEGE